MVEVMKLDTRGVDDTARDIAGRRARRGGIGDKGRMWLWASSRRELPGNASLTGGLFTVWHRLGLSR